MASTWWQGTHGLFVPDIWKGAAGFPTAKTSTGGKSTAAAEDELPTAPPAFGLTLVTSNPSRRVSVLLGDSPPTPRGGGAIHEVIEIPGRQSIIVWRRADLVVMSLPIVVDNFVGGKSVKDDVDALWAMYAGADHNAAPSPVRIAAHGWVVPFRTLHWTVTDFVWGDAEANSHGNRTRQALTLELTEWNPEVRVGPVKYKSVPKKRASKHAKKHGTKTGGKRKVRAVTGDTLATIAQRLDLTGGWQALGLAQTPPITDPRAVTVGQELRLPTGVLIADDVDDDAE